jgi:hypothetical protein
MQTYSFDLLFLPAPDNFPPGPSISEVRLKSYTMGGYTGTPDAPTITPRCISYQELNEQIERLLGELEEIRKEAKKKYSQQRLASN